MFPDDRLRDLLQQAEDRVQPKPEFLDHLFDDLVARRSRRWIGGWTLPRPMAYGILVPLVVVVAVAGLVAATSRGGPRTEVGGIGPSPTLSTSPAPSTSPIPSAEQSPTATSIKVTDATRLCSNGDGNMDIKECKLKAGTYTSSPFKVPFQFTIGPSWTNVLAGINAGQLEKTESTGTGFGWATGMTAEGNADVGKSVDALLAYIAAVPGITASTPSDVTIGGVAGKSVDFSLSKGQIFFMVGKSGTTYSPGEKVRAYLLDVNGSVVLLAVEVRSENDFEKEMATVQPIIDSIVWE